jgi:hypothetical protein
MYRMPVGEVNFGDPGQAYQEAVALGIAHNESFAVEAGAVMAAAYAEAFAEDSSDSICIRGNCQPRQRGYTSGSGCFAL